MAASLGGGAPLIMQAYRFALDPTPSQVLLFDSWLGASRFWFNAALGEVKERSAQRAAGADVHVPWSYHGLCSELSASWRHEQALWQADLPSDTYKSGFEALGAGLQHYARGKAAGRSVGFPRFKKRGRCSESVSFQRARVLDARHVQLHRSAGPVRSKEPLKKLIRL